MFARLPKRMTVTKHRDLDVLHKQLIQMLVHGCMGRSETQTIDEGDEGQVCPCWCVQKGPFLNVPKATLSLMRRDFGDREDLYNVDGILPG